MGDLSELSDRDVDELLAGTLSPDRNGNDGLGAFVAELQTAYLHVPPEGVQDAHIAAAVEARRLAEATERVATPASPIAKPPARSGYMRRERFALVAVALALAAPLGTVGLAAAGVTLPDAVRAPFEALGIELPNQPRSAEVTPVTALPTGHAAQPRHERGQSGSGDKRDANGHPKHSHGNGQSADVKGQRADGKGGGGQGHGRAGHAGGNGATGQARHPSGTESQPTGPQGQPSGPQGGGGGGNGGNPTPTAPENTGGNPHGGPPGQTGSTPVGGGRPTSPPGNSGSNPHGGPPGITGSAPVGHGDKPNPGHGH